MTTQLLIYKSAVPVSKARHADLSVEVRPDFAFSAETNSVPLMAVEFPQAAAEYAIVFAGDRGEILPHAILGLRDRENLYVGQRGLWDAQYLPAFIRRYPFVFSAQGDQLTLCVDEAFPGFNREGRGEPIFAADGSPSAYTQRVLAFLQDYQAQFQVTQRFCAKLRELGLLEPMQAQITVGSGEKLALGGFMTVDRAKLKALPGERLAELAASDELEMLYLHLHSMRNFERLRGRLDGRLAAAFDQGVPAGVH